MKIFKERPYQNVIEFIDVAVDSDELMNWLSNLETLPDNLRSDLLARIKAKMLSNKESDKIIDIVESISNTLSMVSAKTGLISCQIELRTIKSLFTLANVFQIKPPGL